MRFISWNLKVDVSLSQKSWHKRRELCLPILLQTQPDLFCVQEAKTPQLEFLQAHLLNYSFIGVGRDDGKTTGEYCAVFYNTSAVTLLEQGSFWLSSTPAKPSRGYDLYPRICTWGRFKYLSDPRPFTVYNTHLPLAFNLSGKRKALAVLLAQVHAAGAGPKVVAGDFNSGPRSRVWRTLYRAGFQTVPNPQPTTHWLGVPLFCYDAIFFTRDWRINRYGVVPGQRHRPYPSDHFGVLAYAQLS